MVSPRQSVAGKHLMPKHVHGMRYTSLYRVWSGMKSRCSNPRDDRYAKYGARGIKVCPQWQTFLGFHKDMAEGYRPGLSLERKDNEKGYEPDNCHWIPMAEQQRNRRNVVWVTYGGERMILSDAARKAGVNIKTALWRRHRGMPESEWFK